MFSEELEKIDWDETTRTIALKTEADVRRASCPLQIAFGC